MSNTPSITTPQDQPLDRPTAVQQLITDLQAVVTSAQADLTDATLSRSIQANARQVISDAQSMITALQADGVPSAGPTQIIVGVLDTLPLIAQQQLGDPLRYRDIMTLNELEGWNIPVGTLLKVPGA